MFTKKALEYLIQENLPASELPRLQAQFREENYKTLLTAKQIVARFSHNEVSAAYQLLHSDHVISVENYEPDAFAAELRENNRLIFTEIELYKGRVEDIFCSCKSTHEVTCPHIRMLLYYIAYGNNPSKSI